MKKNLLLLFVALFSFSTYTSAQFVAVPTGDEAKSTMSTEEDEFIWGYCGSTVDTGAGVGSSATLSAAIQLSSEQFGMYEGQTITGINIGVAATSYSAKVFIRNTLTGEDIYSQNVGSVSKGWKRIDFTTPFTIPEGEFYVGYSARGLNQIGFSGDTYHDACWLYSGNSWDNYEDSGWGSLCIQLIVDMTGYNTTDMGIAKVFNAVGSKNETITTHIGVRNNSLSTIQSFTMQYAVDDGSPVEKTVSCNLEPGAIDKFAFDIAAIAEAGLYDVTTTLLKVDGADDTYTANNTFNSILTLYDKIVPRYVLLEGFTSSTCGPCVSGNANLKSVLEKSNGYHTLIKYQMSWPGAGDAYYTEEGYVRRAFYGVNSVPWLQVEGVDDMNSSSFTLALLQQLQAVISFIEIDATYAVNGKKVTAEAKITSYIPIEDPNIKLFMAIVEKETVKNVGSNGETLFNQVMKKFMPDAGGIAIGNLPMGTPVSFGQEWEFKGEYRLPPNAGSPINHDTEHSVEDFDNLEVVLWLQNTSTKEVLQSATAVLGDVGIKDIAKEDVDCYVHVKNNSLVVNVNALGNVVIDLYDVSGKKLLTNNSSLNGNEQITIPAEGLKGVYLVKVTTHKGTTVKKVIL